MSSSDSVIARPTRKEMVAEADCPKCASRQIFPVSRKKPLDVVLRLAGFKTLRCRHCFTRFRRFLVG